MYTIKDYLKFYKDISFEDVSFNEIDNILFSELSYLTWKDIVNKKKIKLLDAINLYLDKNVIELNNNFLNGIKENIKIIKDSKRYQDCYLFNFQKEVTDKKQFGAISILFNRNLYISYEGTDNSISGWKENFEMCYTFPTKAMIDAINYINKINSNKYKNIYVGGHSKGGNLAVVASMYAKKGIKKKIKFIYNNDGPGLTNDIFNSKEFKEIESRIKLYIPGDSIVGSLLYQPKITKIVKSNNFSVFEHDCNSWEVFGTMFVETKQSRGSKELKTRTINFLEEFDIDKRKEIIETIFLILEKNNIRYLEDFKKLNLDKLNKILNNIKNIDDKTKKLILNGIKNLLFSKKNVKIS